MPDDFLISPGLAGHGALAPPMSAADSSRVRALVDAHYDFVWRQLRRMGVGESDADDGAQQVFLAAMNKLDSTPIEMERSLLFGVVRRVAANTRRGVARRDAVLAESVEGSPELAVPDSQGAEAKLDNAHARALLDELMARLPDEQREVFCLFEFDELSLDEVAQVVGCARGTAASRLRLARERIARDVQRLRAQHQGATA